MARLQFSQPLFTCMSGSQLASTLDNENETAYGRNFNVFTSVFWSLQME